MRSEDRPVAAIMWVLCIPLPFLVPFLFILFSQNKPLVFNSSVQALGFSCLIILLGILARVLLFVSFGLIPLLWLVGLLHVVVCVFGAINAANGRIFEPLISGPVVKSLMRR